MAILLCASPGTIPTHRLGGEADRRGLAVYGPGELAPRDQGGCCLGVFELCFGFKLWQVSGAIGAFGFEFLSDLAPVGSPTSRR